MTLQSRKIDQKEYLKRYLSGTSDEKKKKKKKIATGIKRVKIIDDDIDLKNMRNLDSNELELYQLSEDAPVIAGVVDERPPEVQQADKYKDKRWKVITGGSDDDVQISDKNEPKNKTKISGLKNNRNLDISPPRKSKPMSKKLGPDFSEFRKSRKKSPSSDQSPQRKSRQNSDSDISPPRKSNNRARQSSDSDMSPDRKPSKKSRQNSDSDISPPRKSNKKSRKNSDSDISPPRKVSKKSRHNSDSDMSPPRKSNKKSRQNLDSDTSPPRKFSKKSKQNSDSDISPPRKSNKKSRKNSDSDISPPRKSNNHKSSSKNNSQKTRNDSDRSPPRHSRRNSDSDLSPPRKSRKETNTSSKYSQRNSDSDLSPPRKSRKETSKYKSRRNSDSDLSPPRKSKNNVKNSSHKSRNGGSDSDLSPPRKQKSDNKMKKTLDGKQAGLQDAKQLVQENQDFKRREDDLFRKMAASVSGADASTVLRDRKTGRVRDLEEEARESRKRNEKDSEHKEKYDKWGRGVKQGQEFQARIKQDLHEMAKPLARYRDDEDLERDLKETLRAEDPMLQYVLSKKEKSEADLKPKYKGAWPPNRFNIPPGYRWDGVDRSSGYEKQLFLSKSAKKATEEEAYHWSISDM